MREFAKISCSIWGSKKFKSLPNEDARIVYFYLHTSPHVNSLGCYVLPFGYALADLGWNDMNSDPIRYRKAIEALCDSGLIGFDEAESVVRIVDFLKHSPFTNAKHAKGAIKILYQIPYCAEKDLLISELSAMKHVAADMLPDSPSDSLSKASRYTETQTETQTETYIGGGGYAQAREAEPGDLTWREQMLEAMGVDHSGLTGHGGKCLGQRVDLEMAAAWETDLGLSRDEILVVIRETMTAKRGGPPGSFGYFENPMRREAARKARPPLQPAPLDEVNHDRPTARDRRSAAEADRLRRVIDDAARID